MGEISSLHVCTCLCVLSLVSVIAFASLNSFIWENRQRSSRSMENG